MTAKRLWLIALAVVLLALTAAPAHAAFPGQNGKIAFARSFQESLFTTKIQIWSVNPDGSGQTVVNDTTGYDRTPSWSPDGRKIAFARVLDPSVDGTFEIYVMNADGTGATRLTNNSSDDSAPSWSPDGSRIAFHARRDGNLEIYAMNADGTGQVNLTNHPESDQDPAWSPDGSKIAFTTIRNAKSEIYAMNPDGTGQVNLTSALSQARDADWSPDGQKIAFTGLDGIYVMNADGSSATRVIASTADVSAVDPAWSPDGQKFAFVRFGPRCGTGCFPAEISVASIDGGGETQLTSTGPSMPNRGPDWQPIGYPRPLAAVNLRVPLTVAFKECGPVNANRTHGPSLTAPSCNPAQQESSFATVGTIDGNGESAQSVGFVKMSVACNPPAPGATPPCGSPGDQADVKLELSTTDIRAVSGLADYTGELEATVDLRITDKHNSATPGGTGQAATAIDLPFPFTAPCTATVDPAVGATCQVATYADAVMPGSVPESKRGNWEVEQVEVFDGGADGQAATVGNTLFAVQGIFIP